MKNEKPRQLHPMPEVILPEPLGKFAHFISRIRPIYWLMITIVVLALFSIFAPHAIWITFFKGLKAQLFLVVMSAAFTLIAVSLVWKTGQHIDVWVFKFINERGHRPLWLDWVMLSVTQIGNGVFAYTVALILLLHNKHLIAYELIFGNLTLWMTIELIKVLIRRTRPYSRLTDARVVGDKAHGASFPSGHTSQAFFMASLLSHYFNVSVFIAIIFYIIALIVGITRMYVGMHYPRDVLGGAILGTAWGLFGVIINHYIFFELNIH